MDDPKLTIEKAEARYNHDHLFHAEVERTALFMESAVLDELRIPMPEHDRKAIRLAAMTALFIRDIYGTPGS